MSQKYSHIFLISFITLFTILGFQNCVKQDHIGNMLESNSTGTVSIPSTADVTNTTLPPIPPPPPPPPNGGNNDGLPYNEDTACFINSSVDTCLFYKNHVTQNGGVFPNGTDFNTDLSFLQIHGAMVTGLDATGTLQNATISVGGNFIPDGNLAYTRPSRSGTGFKARYGNDPNHHYAQIATYYYLRAQERYMVQRTGTFYASGRGIAVDAVNNQYSLATNNAFFSPINNLLVMGVFDRNVYKGGGEVEAGISGDIVAHEMGHANFQHSMPARSSSLNRVNCNSNDTNLGCCVDANGCLGAINEGQADFHAAILFPSSPAIGDGATNDLDGLEAGPLSRDLETNRQISLNASRVVNTFGGVYPIHFMGAVYASIWWAIYVHPASNKQEIETLFTEHLPLLGATDGFTQAGATILNLSSQMYGTKYSSLIRDEFARRSITIP